MPDDQMERLEQLDRALEVWAGGVVFQPEARRVALQRARDELQAAADSSQVITVALLAYASDVLVAHAVELAARPDELLALIGRIQDVAEIPRDALAREVLRAPQLLQLPTAIAIEVELALLLSFLEAEGVSLWTFDGQAELQTIGHAGVFDPGARNTRRLVRRLVDLGEARAEQSGEVVGLLVERRQNPPAVLVACASSATASPPSVLLQDAAPMFSVLLDHEVSPRGGPGEEAAAGAAARRLARLRFDLHDGPQQDVLLLAEDIRLLRAQLESAMTGHRGKPAIRRRLDDLQARVVAIDGDLRRISAFVQSPFLQADAVPEALTKLTDEFSARSGITPLVQLTGDFSELTDSQQITLLGLIREALNNVREHSNAEHVKIVVRADRRGVEATVTDDGDGFEPEEALVKAAREGHLGLVGMHQRVHLLGGRTRITSRAGGPTVISVRLPPWKPPSAQSKKAK